VLVAVTTTGAMRAVSVRVSRCARAWVAKSSNAAAMSP